MSIIFQANQLTRAFKTGSEVVRAVNDVSLAINEHELAILRGRSGSGKTTMINLLGALDAPTSGEILFDGRSITGLSDAGRTELRRKYFSFVFQSIALIPNMTAFENVEFALRLAGVKKRKQRVEECLTYVGMEKRMKHMPSELSGGEQQRIAIARAIAHKPKVVFADEPTAEVDTNMSLRIVNLFRNIIKTEEMTIIMSTHDPNMMELADHVFTLEDGKIIDERLNAPTEVVL